MTASGVTLASSSRVAAEAGAVVARQGGNAVDAAIAAVMVSITTEPGVCSLGCSGFITIWGPGRDPVTIDAYAAMPGQGSPAGRLGENIEPVHLGYGGGVITRVGAGAVATPGAIAGLGLSAERYGQLPWADLLAPAVRVADHGFPLPRNCHEYLVYAADLILGRDPSAHPIFFDEHDQLRGPGSLIRIPGLAETLQKLADRGPGEFYRGEIGHAMADHVQALGGLLTRDDLEAYEARECDSLTVAMDDWTIATSSPPAVGGARLAAMLHRVGAATTEGWTPDLVATMVAAQDAVLRWRDGKPADLPPEALALLAAADPHGPESRRPSSATVHTSAADGSGVGCSITLSAGYGAGVVPPGTGAWLNNSLGEWELYPDGPPNFEPGRRLKSNMAPTVARRPDGTVLAIGSPGAERITSAVLQVLISHLHLGLDLEAAVAHPRAHVERSEEGHRVACEPGLPMDLVDLRLRRFDEPHMFFGGVAAARWSPRSGFDVAGDPRRAGGSVTVTAAEDSG